MITSLRGERSQKSVADAMRKKGYKWSQATVWAVEKGERRLLLTEAADLADEFGVPLQSLLWTPMAARIDQTMMNAAKDIVAAHREIHYQTGRLLEAEDRLRGACLTAEGILSGAGEVDDQHALAIRLSSAREQLDMTPEAAVRMAREDREEYLRGLDQARDQYRAEQDDDDG